jgi:hypothetical protein
MLLGYPNIISIIGDSETMCSKICNNCPLLFYVIHVLTLYIHSTNCVTFLTVTVMNSGHVNYLHYAVYCYNCVGLLQ